MLDYCYCSFLVFFGFLVLTDISAGKISVDGKKKDHSHCGKTLVEIFKYPKVYCGRVLQVLAEFHNKALQYINWIAQNVALSWPGAPGRCLHHVYKYPET